MRADDHDGPFVRVGHLDRVPADARRLFGEKIVPPGFFAPIGSVERAGGLFAGTFGTLFPVPERRELWQLFPFNDDGTKTAIAVRDAASLKIVRSTVVDAQFERGGRTAMGGDWLGTTDGRDRVFFVQDGGGAVLEFDARTMHTRRLAFPQPMNRFVKGGIAYDRHDDRLLVVMTPGAALSVANAALLLATVDLRTGTVGGPRPVRACNGPLPSTEGNRTYQVAPFVAGADWVYVPCQRSGNSGAVVRIPRTETLNGASAEETAVGPTNLETVLQDPGSSRLFLVTKRGEIWAFDTASMSFVGVVGANSERDKAEKLGYGIDPASGRVFFISPTFGLGLVEGRFFPIPQAKTRPELATPGQERIIADADSDRFFVLEGEGVDKAYAYEIFQAQPPPVPPPPPDPDANTSDEPEVPGAAEGRFFASASGYGTRVLLANGLSTVVPALAVGEVAPTADTLAKNLNAKCGFTDRELVAARVTKTESDTGSTAAEAIAVELDPRSTVDLDRPSRCEPYAKHENLNEGADVLQGIFNTAPDSLDNTSETPRWNYEPASCSSSEGGEATAGTGDDNDNITLGSSSVACPLPGGTVVGRAETRLAGVISVGKAWAHSELKRESTGVFSRTEAVAADIQIGDGIRIGEVRSIAESRSNGRPKKGEMSTHVVQIRGLKIGDGTHCVVCDPRDVVDTLNRLLAGRAQFRMGVGAADERLRKGSARGALSAVQKSPERQVSDQALVGDFTTEIPGLELVVFNDNSKWGRARQLYQFAGVSTSATYNIVGVPKGSGGPLDGLPGGLDLEAVDGFAGGSDVPTIDGRPIGDTRASADEGGGIIGAIRRALRAIARGVRLFLTNPRHGILLLTGWGLFVLPGVLYRRRLALADLD